MTISRKYNRTYHYPFSPGTSSDDRINKNYWEDLSRISKVIHTEKLDGENNCISRHGVFARSHATPTQSPWTVQLRLRWASMKHDLGDLEIFGENLYAIHSIEYQRLEDTFFVFAIRENNQWLSWEEVCFYAGVLDLPTVPVLARVLLNNYTQQLYEQEILTLTAQPSQFGSVDTQTQLLCTCEGIVTRNIEAFEVDNFQHHVFKYVRKGHVKTDEHWTKNWKKANVNYR